MIYLIINNLRYFFNRIIIAAISTLLIYFIYFFSSTHVHFGNYIFNNPFRSYMNNIDFWLYLLVYFTIISILNVFGLFFLSMYFTIRKKRVEEIRMKYQLLFTEKIIGYIFSEQLKDYQSIIEYFLTVKKTLRRKKTKETFFSIVIIVQENINEDLSEKYNVMFELLGLKKHISYLLYSRKLSEKIIALKIISCLKMKGNEKIIAKYSTSNNYVLRTVALDTLIKLSETDHLAILLAHEHLISILDINVIIHGVEKNRKADIDYLSLIQSESTRIIAIGLLLIKSRNKYEYKDIIKPLLESKDSFLNQIAWEVYISFADTKEDLEFLTEKFHHVNFWNKLQIIKGSGSFKQYADLYDFLDEIITNEDILLKIEALRIIFINNISRFQSYEGSNDKNITAGYNEIVDLNLT
jgi:hypothetical protein